MTIQKVGVVGAGIMGNGIAQTAAVAGLSVILVDIDQAALERGMNAIDASLSRMVKKGALESSEKALVLARIALTTGLDELAGADAVIEAASENQAIKLALLKQIAAVLPATAILATNTSSMSITRLAAAVSKPDRFIGMHFFNPVPVMGLVELIRGLQTSDDTHARAMALAQRLAKTPITVRNNPGFAVNRILCPMINEAIFALSEGLASAEDIDAGMRLGCNHPIGPLALADLIGLDTLLAVLNMFYDGFNDSKYRPAPMLKEMVDAGYLGKKSGRGFYQYG